MQFAIELTDADFRSALQRAVEDARDGDAAQEFAVVEVHYLKLESCRRIARRNRNTLHNRFEQWQQVLGTITRSAVRDTFARVRVDHWEIELIFRGVEVNEEVVDFVEDFLRPGVRAINLI